MPEVNRKELRQLIKKRQFTSLFLIYGEEKMYVKTDTDLLVSEVAGKNPSEFNFHNFTKDYSLDDVAVAVQVVPFVSEYNVVRIADIDLNSLVKEELEQLLEIIKNVPDTTVMIITMPTLEQNPKKLGAGFTKVLNLIKKSGTVCAMNRETDISLASQLVRWADKRGIKLEKADAFKIQEYVGNDLNMLKNELDKLCNYVGDNSQITTGHIEMLVTKNMQANIFYLTDEIVRGNSTKAFEILDILFYQRADANEIINIIGMAYTDFYRARVASESGTPPTDIAKEFGYGNRAFVLKNANSKTRNIPTPKLRKSLDEIIDVTAKLRSVSSNERIMLEKLVAKLIMLARGEA